MDIRICFRVRERKDAVSNTAARYADNRPELDETSRRASNAPGHAAADSLPTADQLRTDPRDERITPEDTLWLVLSMAPDQGSEIGDLTRLTGMSRPTLYRHLAQLAKSGRAVQVSRGHWRARTTDEPSP